MDWINELLATIPEDAHWTTKRRMAILARWPLAKQADAQADAAIGKHDAINQMAQEIALIKSAIPSVDGGSDHALTIAKLARQAEVDAITVTVGEKVFDGDERSQDRMSRAINAMDDTDQTLWVLADNTPTMVTKAELRSALRLAGEAQTTIWIKPYQ